MLATIKDYLQKGALYGCLLLLPTFSFAQPANNTCGTAATLTVGTSCTNTTGSVRNSNPTATGVPTGCGNAGAGDVWYRFVATTAHVNITLSGIGNRISQTAYGGGIRLQLLDGSCGSFRQITCATGSFNTSTLLLGEALIPGNTYYIRILTANTITYTGGTATDYEFRICLQSVNNTTTAPRFGNTYVNLSKQNVGGVVEKGDTLEIRMTIALLADVIQYFPRYVDNVPTNTQMLSGPNDSIRVITNEGLTYKRYTPLAGDDAATYIASPPTGQYNIRLNLGFGAFMPPPTAPPDNGDATTTGARVMSFRARPLGGGRLLFATAFRVRVTGDPGDIITLGSGKLLYRETPTGADFSVNAIPYQILISNPKTLCVNAAGVNNAQEFGGTFGQGTSLNRTTPLDFSPTGYTYINNMGGSVGVGDGQFAIVKNLSPHNGTIRNPQALPNCVLPVVAGNMNSCYYRMYNGHWDVDGDHSGTNDQLGNMPPAATANSGYMLMVNADYVSSKIYEQTLTGLCPNTYYEFSAWLRNICPNCGVDSTGAQTMRPGVNPNLTFTLDDIDQYSTGEVGPTGWEKKGFVFVTGPTQTTVKFSIRNNAQGGGGNDWVLDDISIATCLPNMSYSPTLNPSVCIANPIGINDTIRSIYSNYRHHLWQRSTNGGVTWTNVGVARDSTPVFNSTLGMYEYVTSLTVDPVNTTPANNGDMYRVLAATTAANIATSTCQVTDGVSMINLAVINCAPVLATDLLSFSGKLLGTKGNLSWSTSREETPVSFLLEKSWDGENFSILARLNGHNNGAGVNNYGYVDELASNQRAYYRLALVGKDGNRKYSRVVELSSRIIPKFEFVNVINPFSSNLQFDLSSPMNSRVQVSLVDLFGKTVIAKSFQVYEGLNSLNIPATSNVVPGTYVLVVNQNNKVLHRTVVKNRY